MAALRGECAVPKSLQLTTATGQQDQLVRSSAGGPPRPATPECGGSEPRPIAHRRQPDHAFGRHLKSVVFGFDPNRVRRPPTLYVEVGGKFSPTHDDHIIVGPHRNVRTPA